MNNNWQEIENVRKKCEDLDKELSTFFNSIKEIKSVRDSLAGIPDKLKQNEADIENQKKEIQNMLSSTSNLLITFEEQAKGLFFDLEKKTDSLTGDVKTGISELRNIFELNSARLHEEQKERLEQVITVYEHIQLSFENITNKLTLHEQSITALQNNYAGTLKIFEKSEQSFGEIKKTLAEVRKPYDVENRIKGLEHRMMQQFGARLERQKYAILATAAALTAAIILFIFYPG